MSGFLIVGLPRSRTAWLSALLTYRDFICEHEGSLGKNMAEIVSDLSRGKHGYADTLIVSILPTICHLVSELRVVLVVRNKNDVIESIKNINLFRNESMISLNALYDCIEALKLNESVLKVTYEDLCEYETCNKIHKYCLDEDLPIERWEKYKNKNIQADANQIINRAASCQHVTESVYGKFLRSIQ